MLLPGDIWRWYGGGFCVEAGAGNGGPTNPTYGVLTEHAWRGLLVECDADKFSALAGRWPSVALSNARLDPYNVATLFASHDVPRNFEWFVLDIDGYDCSVAEAVLDAGYRPQLLTVEVNEKIAYPIKFSVRYSPAYAWRVGHFYGASIARWEELLLSSGYVAVGCDGCNLHAVPATSPHAISAEPIVKLWHEHMRPWALARDYNADVAYWLDNYVSAKETISEIEKWYAAHGVARDEYDLYL